MFRCDDRDHVDAQQRIRDDVLGHGGKQQTNGQRGRVIAQATQGTTETLCRKTDGKVGIGTAQRVQALDQRCGWHQWINRKSEFGLHSCPVAGRNRLEARRAGQYQTRLLDKHVSNIRESWPMTASVEQADALQFLKGGNRLADGRLRTTKLAGSSRKATHVRNGHQHTQVIQAETTECHAS